MLLLFDQWTAGRGEDGGVSVGHTSSPFSISGKLAQPSISACIKVKPLLHGEIHIDAVSNQVLSTIVAMQLAVCNYRRNQGSFYFTITPSGQIQQTIN